MKNTVTLKVGLDKIRFDKLSEEQKTKVIMNELKNAIYDYLEKTMTMSEPQIICENEHFITLKVEAEIQGNIIEACEIPIILNKKDNCYTVTEVK